jgi:putative PIN family toxin of toxin-antitoxin system
VFLDANVWLSAFTTHGLCADLVRLLMRLHGDGEIVLLLSEQVRRETERVLRDKFMAAESDLVPVRMAMELAELAPDASWELPADFPDPDDAPIVAAALAAHAGLFATGDKALAALGTLDGMQVLTPRQLYESLLGID